MQHQSHEKLKLSKSYDVHSRHDDDLTAQFEQISEFELAAEQGDWKKFKNIVNRDGSVFLKLMRRDDGDPRLRLPLIQSGELEDRFTESLKKFGKSWSHLMPWWARLGYKYEAMLTWVSMALVLGAVAGAATGNSGFGGASGAGAILILMVVDNSEPRFQGSPRWWVRLTYRKPKLMLNRWRMVVYLIAALMISWAALADTFRTPTQNCEGLSPADLVALNGCN
ncbi:MAG: hypothetical protein HN926_01455 [Chloroflexi bacterium]|jgi:hypothetical protein|nr:hypothetical protein [Chloroflexota bacterium]MBT3864144.1 hypothetical protein [Chloroflexota bacterium]MBT4342167.1 hypothetical protein [Chloroflexota bacterium]MBT4942489.1 hypothetical protein [Chloroflexota bacterium]MBT5253455.1 hypothetical protein [Chloroflexota bacterium]